MPVVFKRRMVFCDHLYWTVTHNLLDNSELVFSEISKYVYFHISLLLPSVVVPVEIEY